MQTASGVAQSMVSIDHDYTGDDFSATLKAVNPSILEGGLTGTIVGSYLQSITPSLALGLEGVWMRQSLGTKPETALSYSGRYKGNDWVGTAQLQAAGVIEATYWRKLTEKVEAGVKLELAFPSAGMFGTTREGTASIGAKYDFRASTFRAQIDSAGKVGCYLDKRVAPSVSLSFAGEIDQVKVRDRLPLAMQTRLLTRLSNNQKLALRFPLNRRQRILWSSKRHLARRKSYRRSKERRCLESKH